MGNNPSQNPMWHSSDPNIVLSTENLTHLGSKEDQSLGSIEEFQHKTTNGVLFSKEIILKDPAQLTSENLQKLKTRVELKHTNLLKIYGFCVSCPEEGPSKLSIYFEHFTSNVSNLIQLRFNKNEFFDEQELHNSLLDVIKALEYLQKHKISHGNLRPNTIFMSDEGQIKLLDNSLLQNENAGFEACLEGETSPYIAPELLSCLDYNKQIPKNFDAWKADIFSLGMIFIHLALLKEPSACYNWKEHLFHSSRLFELYDRVQVKYRGQFANLISHMVRVEPSERLDARAILANIDECSRQDWFLRRPRREAGGSPRREGSGSPNRVDEIVQQVLGQNRSRSPNRVDELVREILTKNRIRNSSYLTSPYKQTSHSSTLDYSFLDPKVKQIIKEVKEKNQIKGLPHERSRSPSQDRLKALYDTGLRYKNPFLDPYASPYRSHLSKSAFIDSYEPIKGEFSSTVLKFNSPRVNQIISEMKRYHERKLSPYKTGFSGLDNSRYSASSKSRDELPTNKSWTQYERLPNVNALFNLPVHTSKSYETPDRNDSKYERTNYQISNLNSKYLSPDKNTKSNDEIIKELRAKYGSKKKNQEKKEAQEVRKEAEALKKTTDLAQI